jgi:membrane protease YdiL (CAAX protease family)
MVALLTAPLALALTMLALSQFSGDFVPAFVGAGLIDPAGPIEANDGATLLLLGVAVGLGAGFFEELGWTGFAIPSLRVRHGATAAGLVVGVLWGAWHFLAIWWGSTNAVGSVSVPLYLLVALFSFLLPYRVLMLRVYERTRSLLVAIVMHASLTTSMIILGPPVSGVEALVYDLAFAAVLWLIVGASSVVSDRIMIVTERHSIR